jgi:hypothetical protein
MQAIGPLLIERKLYKKGKGTDLSYAFLQAQTKKSDKANHMCQVTEDSTSWL